MNMSNELQDRISGDRGRIIDEAIDCYNQKLQMRNPESMPQECTRTQINLGNALKNQISGDQVAA